MAIITDIYENDTYWIWVSCGSNNKYYEKLGYVLPKRKDKYNKMSVPEGTKILVRVNDLSKGSKMNVTKICDICGEKSENQPFHAILNCREKGDGLDRCLSCGWKKGKVSIKENIPFEKSLEYNFPEIAKTWHLTKNGDLTPDRIFANSGIDYWWLCPNCSSDFDLSPNLRVSQGQNCPYCAGSRVNNTNCMWTTAPEVAKLLWNSEDGYKYTYKSNQKSDFKCSDCGSKINNKTIMNITAHGLFCPFCSDGVSYPEKFIYNFFCQLGIDFEYQKTFSWSKETGNINDKLNGYKRYDYYIPAKNCIVEVHGIQHYVDGYKSMGVRRSLEEEQENDKIKETLARNNDLCNYIVIDCAKSELEYIRDNIVKSKLSDLYDINTVDWLKCHEYTCSTLVRVACDYFNSNNITAKGISKIMKMSPETIRKYLRQGTKIGWCDYDPKEEQRKNYNRVKGIPVVMLSLDGVYIEEFASAKEAAKKISKHPSTITIVCKRKQKSSAGFKWMYKTDYMEQSINKI